MDDSRGVDRRMSDWLEAEQRMERAQQLCESQRWQEALAEIDAAISINPHNAVWHMHRGFLLEELERWEEAADAYRCAHELEPGDSEIAVALGATLAHLGRFSQALAIFEDLAARFPNYEPAYCHRIGIYVELGRHEQAEQMFYLAQGLDERCPHCFYHMGASLAARKEFDRAIYCWQRVLELCPDYVGVNRLIAQVYRTQGKFAVAKEFYLREVRDDPDHIDLLFDLAELALESGEVTMAAARFAQIVELDPGYAVAHFALGKICLERGQAEPALRCFEIVRSLTHGQPDLPGFEIRIGEALLRLQRFDEARRELQKAVEDAEGADATEACVLLGTCLLGMGKLDEATDAFRRALAVDARHAVAHHRLGVSLLRQRRYVSALDHCVQAIQVQPDFVAAMHTAILAQLRLARWQDARSMLRRALRLEPLNSDLRRLAARFWRYRLRYYLGRMVFVLSRLRWGADA